MKNNKLLKILSTFSEQEFRRFKKILQSPFFTGNVHLLSLYLYLKKYYPQFDSPQLAKDRVFQKLFPAHDYSDIKLRNLFREMTGLAEDFLLHQKIKQERQLRRKMLMTIYEQRRQHDLFDREVTQLRTALEEEQFEDMELYQMKYDLNLRCLEVLPSNALIDRFQLLLKTEVDLEIHYRLSKAKIRAELESFRGILSSQQTQAVEAATGIVMDQILLYELYQQITQLYATSDLAVFEKVKNRLMENAEKIRPSIQVELLMHLINFTIRQMKKDDRHFNQLAFELYRFGLDENILVQDDQLHDTAYLNIAVAGAKSNAFAWTKQFLEDYAPLVPNEVRQDVKTLADANLLFHQGLFSQAIEDLGQHSFVHPLYTISARIHALRCYYELFLQDLTYFDLLTAQVMAFEKFVRRSKVYNDAFSKACLNFVLLLNKLANLRIGRKLSLTNRQLMRKKLKEQEHTISRSWLLEKIEQ